MSEEPRTGEHMTTPLLEIRGLSVSYRTRGGTVPAVQGVDLDVRPGQVTAVVGESGSGKSTTAHAITRLLPGNGGIDAGTVRFGRHDLATLSEAELRTVRGARIGLVPQDPSVSLNPVKRIGDQVAEVLRIHHLATRRSAPAEAIAVLDRAGLPDAAVRARQRGLRHFVMPAQQQLPAPQLRLLERARPDRHRHRRATRADHRRRADQRARRHRAAGHPRPSPASHRGVGHRGPARDP